MARKTDVIDEVVHDHKEIKALFGKVETSSGKARHEAFEALVRKLAVHETAEQEVVHPLTQSVHAKQVMEKRLSEEKQGEKALAALEEMGPDNPQFDEKFAKLKAKVLEHADQEEREEHVRLRDRVEADKLEALAPVFRAAESSAPTRPHPGGPTSAAGNMTVGPMTAIMDRARDAVREAKKKAG
jgi:hemerythrin superfamily protein